MTNKVKIFFGRSIYNEMNKDIEVEINEGAERNEVNIISLQVAFKEFKFKNGDKSYDGNASTVYEKK